MLPRNSITLSTMINCTMQMGREAKKHIKKSFSDHLSSRLIISLMGRNGAQGAGSTNGARNGVNWWDEMCRKQITLPDCKTLPKAISMPNARRTCYPAVLLLDLQRVKERLLDTLLANLPAKKWTPAIWRSEWGESISLHASNKHTNK